jgi:hypothetical protein
LINALWLLAAQGLIGAFDTVYYHEWRARLPALGRAALRRWLRRYNAAHAHEVAALELAGQEVGVAERARLDRARAVAQRRDLRGVRGLPAKRTGIPCLSSRVIAVSQRLE